MGDEEDDWEKRRKGKQQQDVNKLINNKFILKRATNESFNVMLKHWCKRQNACSVTSDY